MSVAEYHAAAKGESWKMRLMNTIDNCMKHVGSKAQFVELMEFVGYGVKWTDTRKSITYTTLQGMKCRDDRLHETKYLKERMELELRIREEIINGRTQKAVQQQNQLIKTQLNSQPTRSELELISKSLSQIQQTLSPAGKMKEKRFSIPSWHLPRLEWTPRYGC